MIFYLKTDRKSRAYQLPTRKLLLFFEIHGPSIQNDASETIPLSIQQSYLYLKQELRQIIESSRLSNLKFAEQQNQKIQKNFPHLKNPPKKTKIKKMFIRVTTIFRRQEIVIFD